MADIDVSVSTTTTIELAEAQNTTTTIELMGAQNTITPGTYDHNLLQNRDAENQHPVFAINGLSELLDQKIDGDKIGNGLKYEDGILSIDTADTVEQDNTKPVTSAAVYTKIGNIEALLANI